VKIALITTPPSVRSGIGDYTRHLLPYLREHCDVQSFVAPGFAQEEELEREGLWTIDRLVPREFDQVLYQLGNEANHGFMARMIRSIGGTVMQHDWVLFDLAMAAFPALCRGGAKGHALALREGGLRQARIYSKNWLDRRRQRRHPSPSFDASSVRGTLLVGWHEPEDGGRWTADHAALRIPDTGVERVEIDVHVDPPRTIRILQGNRVLHSGGGGTTTFELVEFDRPVLTLETTGIRVTKGQRDHGDSRRLGSFVRRVSWKGDGGVQDLDLAEPCVLFDTQVNLSRDRFLLPLNRSVVRFADSFLVHSDYVKERILRERNSVTPIGVLHHGAECRWREEDRAQTRARLGLDSAWRDSFLITSFGGVQPHKRVDKALEALALVRRERRDVRLVLAGSMSSSEFDPVALSKRLGIADAVRFTGFVPEEEGWDWLHAGDVALNLRGPSSGGTSGGIFQAFSFGRPVIASDAAEQRELPDSCVLKIPLGAEEVPTLARTIRELRDDPALRSDLESRARRFVEDECHWSRMARRYTEFLDRFPAPRVSRRKLVSMRLALQRHGARPYGVSHFPPPGSATSTWEVPFRSRVEESD